MDRILPFAARRRDAAGNDSSLTGITVRQPGSSSNDGARRHGAEDATVLLARLAAFHVVRLVTGAAGWCPLYRVFGIDNGPAKAS
jgi:hypothetical protein